MNRYLTAAAVVAVLGLQQANAAILINEVDVFDLEGDEFVELYNTGSTTVDLTADKYVLVIVQDSPSPPYHQTTDRIALTGTIAPGEHWVIGRNTIPGVDQGLATAFLPDSCGVAVYRDSELTDFPLFTPHPSNLTAKLEDAVLTSFAFGSTSSELIAILAPGWNEMSEANGASYLTDSIQRYPDASGEARDFTTFVASVATPGAANGYVDEHDTGVAVAFPISSNTLRILMDEEIQPSSLQASDISLRIFTGTFTTAVVGTATSASVVSGAEWPNQVIDATFATTFNSNDRYFADVGGLTDARGNVMFFADSSPIFNGGPLTSAEAVSREDFGCSEYEDIIGYRGTIVSARDFGTNVFIVRGDDGGFVLVADYSYFANPANAYVRYSKIKDLQVGDSVVVGGTVGLVCNAPFITGGSFSEPSFISKVGSTTPAPLVPLEIIVDELIEQNLYKWVRIPDVQIQTASTTFAANTKYDIVATGARRGAGAGKIYIDGDTDLVGTAIPTGTVTLEGFVLYVTGDFVLAPTGVTGLTIEPTAAEGWMNYQ